ncbi:MAG: CDP-glucose 4,6-dehydratase [Deltaproteobacteria bacterium]|nr:CDP-glucose 4,6-dehydratase [Deltaproteobacteria bacterium]
MIFENIYRGKRVFITGHTGFKGAWLALWLTLLGADVIGYSIAPPSRPNLFEAVNLADDVTHLYGDIRDRDNLQRAMAEHQPDMVFHLAAQPLVRLSYDDPHLTYETNVMGTVNVFEAVRLTPRVRVVVSVTSDKCYENREWAWGYRENDPMGGYDPYSSSKGCAELITAAYQRSFFSQNQSGRPYPVALASARAGNVIGGGDWGKDRLLPDCIRALSADQEIVIRFPKAIRPWQHVLTPLSGYLMLGANLWEHGPKFAGGWNFGPVADEMVTVDEIVRTTLALWGKGSYRLDDQTNPHEAHWLKLDCSKALVELGWRPQYSVLQALEKSILWYKLFYQDVDPVTLKDYTISQIKEYERMISC